MVADAGWNTWLATSMYQGKVGKQVYDGRLDATILHDLSAESLGKPTGKNQAGSRRWSTIRPRLGTARRDGIGDKPALSPAMSICDDRSPIRPPPPRPWPPGRRPTTTPSTGRTTTSRCAAKRSPRSPRRRARRWASITTVPWSHATPAGLGGAHNVSRDDYAEIANEMLDAPWLDVIMGAGHPDFDDNGQPLHQEETTSKQRVRRRRRRLGRLEVGQHRPAGS